MEGEDPQLTAGVFHTSHTTDLVQQPKCTALCKGSNI